MDAGRLRRVFLFLALLVGTIAFGLLPNGGDAADTAVMMLRAPFYFFFLFLMRQQASYF